MVPTRTQNRQSMCTISVLSLFYGVKKQIQGLVHELPVFRFSACPVPARGVLPVNFS